MDFPVSTLAEFAYGFSNSLKKLQNYAATIIKTVADFDSGDNPKDLPNCLFLWILGNYGPEYQQFKHTESLNLSLGLIFKVNRERKIEYCAKNIVNYVQTHLSEYRIPMDQRIQYEPHPELFRLIEGFNKLQIEYMPIHDVINISKWLYDKHSATHTLEEIYSITKIYSTFRLITRESEFLSLPPDDFNLMKRIYNIELECFATPLDYNLPKYCSPFPYIDYIFGSVGNFFYMKNINVNCECNPPFTEDIYNNVARMMVEYAVKNNITVILITPNWKDCEGFNILKTYIDTQFPGQFDNYFKHMKIKYTKYSINNSIKQIYPSSTFRFILQH